MDTCSDRNLGFLSYINEKVLFQCITSLVFFCVFLFIYIIKTYSFFSRRHIPEGKTPTFPFGNIKDVVFQQNTFYQFVWKNHLKFKRKDYKYGGVYLFLKPGIVIVEPSLIRKVLSDENKFNHLYDKKLSTLDYVKIVNIFNPTNLNSFLSDYEQSSSKETLKTNLLKDDFENVLRNFFIQTTSLAFGFASHEILNEINDELKKIRESSFGHILSLIYPIFKKDTFNPDLKEILQEIWQVRKKNDIRKNDLIQSFFDYLNEEKCEMKDIAIEVFQIFIENLIYSYSVTTFCLLELCRNTDIQEELGGEIRRFKKEAGVLNIENISKLKYLDSVVKETLRKYPPVPCLLMQNKLSYKLTDDVNIDKEMLVVLSIFGIHHDAANYTDPKNFDPDRFLEDNKEDRNIFMPFGCNKRSEIGMNFIVLHIKLGLLAILSTFTIQMDFSLSSVTNAVELDTTCRTVQPKEPYHFQFEPL